jgi:hypothetical protein
MNTITDAISLCDELFTAAKRLDSGDLRRAVEEYASDQHEALEVMRKQLSRITTCQPKSSGFGAHEFGRAATNFDQAQSGRRLPAAS